jgi:hypothetical protein
VVKEEGNAYLIMKMFMFKRNKISQFTIIMMTILFFFSCSGRQPLVKPDGTGKKVDRGNVLKTSPLRVNNSSENMTNKYKEAEKQYRRFWTHIFLIEIACELYHDTYLTLPDELTDLCDGFMLLWPGNVYQQGHPVKILNSMPDPDNPHHRGNVYYQRYDGHEAILKFIIPDIRAYQTDKTKWILSEQRIVSDTAKLLLNPQEEGMKPSSKAARFLIEATSAERYSYGHVRIVSQSLSYLLDDSLIRTGILDDALVDLITESEYFLIDKGLENIRKDISDKKIIFDFGSYRDNSYVFLNCRHPADEYKPRCRRFNPYKGISGEVESLPECPMLTNETIGTLFSSDDVLNLTMPDDISISKKDVIM